jgi:hypothetical protein
VDAKSRKSTGPRGLFELAICYLRGWGCAKNARKAIELFREAALLEHRSAMAQYGELAFRERDWERFYWTGRAAVKKSGVQQYILTVRKLVPSLESGKEDRLLHTIAVVLRAHLDVEHRYAFGTDVSKTEMVELVRLLKLHDALLGVARRAIDCWSVVARRLGVVKDVRVMNAKMAWEEVWRWGEKQKVDESNSS